MDGVKLSGVIENGALTLTESLEGGLSGIPNPNSRFLLDKEESPLEPNVFLAARVNCSPIPRKEEKRCAYSPSKTKP